MTTRRELVIRLAPVAPPCFSSRTQWLEFVVSAAESQNGDNAGPLIVRPGEPTAFNRGFAYCRGCAVQHKAEMLLAGRCDPMSLVKEQE